MLCVTYYQENKLFTAERRNKLNHSRLKTSVFFFFFFVRKKMSSGNMIISNERPFSRHGRLHACMMGN